MRRVFIACFFFVMIFVGFFLKQSFKSNVDWYGFHFFGRTFFSFPEETSLSHILIHSGLSRTSPIIVEGDVVSLGALNSFLVLEENLSRVVVLMSRFVDVDLSHLPGSRVRVLGVIEGASHEAPLLKAMAVKEI